ncbi:hypothetical protein H257_09871 [Aphanomyces astaci]|uniref:Uncharacterized protein n=1 Tax=Aphanomyces astaci TaxID=112090 RepID=W4G8A6_APHAT|nr:hypothetical protein H257_09871 [Aphanomyces astaci]ETV75910.1 hypothetical protein H257_09871 [Aphanomyces astaci]|eukprot:XP_009834552.1 hypothetical protein H257_09871 [Aphanomyces astaci]
MNAQATGLVPLEDNDSARVSTPGRKREADGSPHVSPPTYCPETQSPLKRPALTSAADLPLVLTSPLARTGTDGRESNAETLERYTSLVQAEVKRTASLLFFQQANEDRARLLGVQETQLVEVVEGLRIARASETHESRRQDEFQKALTYLQDCYTQELDVARAQKDAERVLEVRRRKDHLRHDGLMSSLREELRTLKRNHQEEILLVREAARDEDNSKGVAYDLLQSQSSRRLRNSSQYRRPSQLPSGTSLSGSLRKPCGNCPILEKEKQDLREALRERERSLKEEVQRRQGMEQVWEEEHRRLLESEEMARELQESILTEQNR